MDQDELNEKFRFALTVQRDLERAKELYAQGADVNYEEEGGLPLLHQAVSTHSRESILWLISLPETDLTRRDKYGLRADERALVEGTMDLRGIAERIGELLPEGEPEAEIRIEGPGLKKEPPPEPGEP